MTLSIEELKLLFKKFELKKEENVEVKIDGEKVGKLITPSNTINKDNHD